MVDRKPRSRRRRDGRVGPLVSAAPKLTRWMCALAILCALGTASATNVHSHVEFAEGRTSIVDAKGQSRPARVGEKVIEGETLVVGAGRILTTPAD